MFSSTLFRKDKTTCPSTFTYLCVFVLVYYDTIPPTLQVIVCLHRVPGGGDGGVEDEEQCARAGPYS